MSFLARVTARLFTEYEAIGSFSPDYWSPQSLAVVKVAGPSSSQDARASRELRHAAARGHPDQACIHCPGCDHGRASARCQAQARRACDRPRFRSNAESTRSAPCRDPRLPGRRHRRGGRRRSPASSTTPTSRRRPTTSTRSTWRGNPASQSKVPTRFLACYPNERAMPRATSGPAR